MLDEVNWLLQHNSLAYFMARGISLEGDEGYQVNHSKTRQIPRWNRKRPECMLAQAPEECHNPSWLHRDASALLQCAPPFVSPCKTGCALSRCRNRHRCLALPVIVCVKNSSTWSNLGFPIRPFRTTCLGARCSSEVTRFSHGEARGAPVSTTWLTHAVWRALLPAALLLTTTLIFTYQLCYAATLVLPGVVFAF